jgi:hypothetical protein
MFAWLRRWVSRMQPARPVGRNERCPCGSGRKFKRCCIERVEDEHVKSLNAAVQPEPEPYQGVANRALERANRYRTPK